MHKFESIEHKQQYDDIMKQLSELYNKEYDCLKLWIDQLNTFVNDNPTQYFVLNGNIHIMKLDFSASVINKKNDKSIYWARFDGIVLYDNEDAIDDSFKHHITIKPGDTLERCSVHDYTKTFSNICNRVFANTDKNFEYQYQHYPFNFIRHVLEDKPEYFPQEAIQFCERLEIELDKEIDDNTKE